MMSFSDPKYKIGFTTMTADLLHPGHLDFLKFCRYFCSTLIVGLTTDELGNKQKRKPFFQYKHRRTLLLALPQVDIVVPNRGEDKQLMIDELELNVVFIGSDYRNSVEYEGLSVPVIYVPRALKWSTTKLITGIQQRIQRDISVLAYGIYGPVYLFNNASGPVVVKSVHIGASEKTATKGKDMYGIAYPPPRNWKQGSVVTNEFPMISGVNPHRELNVISLLQAEEWFPVMEYFRVFEAPTQTFLVHHLDETKIETLVRERQFPSRVFWVKQIYAGKTMPEYLVEFPQNFKHVCDIVHTQIQHLNTHYKIIHGDLHPNNICIRHALNGDLIVSFIDWGWCMAPDFPMEERERKYYQDCLKENFDQNHFDMSLTSFGFDVPDPLHSDKIIRSLSTTSDGLISEKP